MVVKQNVFKVIGKSLSQRKFMDYEIAALQDAGINPQGCEVVMFCAKAMIKRTKFECFKENDNRKFQDCMAQNVTGLFGKILSITWFNYENRTISGIFVRRFINRGAFLGVLAI